MNQMVDEAARTVATDGVAAPRARLLFRYLGGEEWQEYRAATGAILQPPPPSVIRRVSMITTVAVIAT